MSIQLIIGIVLALLAVGGISFFIGKRQAKKILEGGKVIGDSEGNDEGRDEVISESEDQTKTNEDVIKESEEAIKRAQSVLEEARKKVREMREKANSSSGNDSSGS